MPFRDSRKISSRQVGAASSSSCLPARARGGVCLLVEGPLHPNLARDGPVNRRHANLFCWLEGVLNPMPDLEH